jgi:hypothetical protein
MCFGGGGGGGGTTQAYKPGTFGNPGKPSDDKEPPKIVDPLTETRTIGLLDNQRQFGKKTLGE